MSDQDVQYMRGIVQSILVTDSKAMVEQALKSEDFRVKAFNARQKNLNPFGGIGFLLGLIFHL